MRDREPRMEPPIDGMRLAAYLAWQSKTHSIGSGTSSNASVSACSRPDRPRGCGLVRWRHGPTATTASSGSSPICAAPRSMRSCVIRRLVSCSSMRTPKPIFRSRPRPQYAAITPRSPKWKRTDNVWWHGPDDANVCVLRVTPLTAELWDGPSSKAVAAFEFLKARVRGERPNLGENRKVMGRMRLQPGNNKTQSGPRRPRRQAQG